MSSGEKWPATTSEVSAQTTGRNSNITVLHHRMFTFIQPSHSHLFTHITDSWKLPKLANYTSNFWKEKRRRTSAQRLYPFHKYIPAQSSLCRLGSWSIIRSSLQVSTSGLWHQSKHDVRGGGCVDEGVGSVLDSNFSVNWHLRWLATVTTRCSLTRLLSWGWEKPHGWFQVTLEVQCSPAETQNIC